MAETKGKLLWRIQEKNWFFAVFENPKGCKCVFGKGYTINGRWNSKGNQTFFFPVESPHGLRCFMRGNKRVLKEYIPELLMKEVGTEKRKRSKKETKEKDQDGEPTNQDTDRELLRG